MMADMLLGPRRRPQIDEGKCGHSAGVERRVGGHEAGGASFDRRSQVKAVLNGVPNLEGNCPSGKDKGSVGHKPERAGCKVCVPQIACFSRPFKG